MVLRGSRVGVTGASGFLGSHVTAALELAGAEVVAVVRRPERAAWLDVECREADLLDEDALSRAFAGLDSVVNCAALYTLRFAPWEEFYRANVTGTEHVFRALKRADVHRCVHISTWGIYRFFPGRLTEDAPQVDGEHKKGGGYRATKQIAEARAWSMSGDADIALTTLRPGGIYGARDHALLPMLRKLARLPVAPAPTLLAPLVYAGDVAGAVVYALARDVAKGRAYNLGGPDASFAEFMKALKIVDKNARGFTLPIPAPLTLTLDNSRAARELDFSNRDFLQGLYATFAEEESRPQ